MKTPLDGQQWSPTSPQLRSLITDEERTEKRVVVDMDHRALWSYQRSGQVLIFPFSSMNIFGNRHICILGLL